MRMILLILVIIVAGCKNSEPNSEPNSESIKTDTLENTPDVNEVINRPNRERVVSISKTYSNKRFKDVSVERLGENKFRVRGQGQIFEANFVWVVEDGHEELYKGYQMTDAGAPEWGNFVFTIDVTKKRENSTLTLILFESSAKDGSRQYELPIALEL
jgi:hypothetical protein